MYFIGYRRIQNMLYPLGKSSRLYFVLLMQRLIHFVPRINFLFLYFGPDFTASECIPSVSLCFLSLKINSEGTQSVKVREKEREDYIHFLFCLSSFILLRIYIYIYIYIYLPF
jgi:hypothetical protein